MNNPTKVPLQLPIQYGIERDVLINSSNLINIYAVPEEQTTSKNVYLYASGFESPSSVGSDPIRAQFVYKGIQYLVSGISVYKRDSLGVVTFIGNISAGAGYVGITANQTQIIFVDGSNGYIFDINTSTFTQIVFGFPITPVDVEMLDNYFIVINGGTQQFFVSAVGDGLTWDELKTANFQSTPDTLVAVFALKRRLYLFGTQSIESWYDAGGTPFPLVRDNNALFEHGCISPSTIKEGFEVMLYLSSNANGAPAVMLVEGAANPRKVSTPPIDFFLQNADDISQSDAILYKENGFTFYQISFSVDDVTLVYVLETNRWHTLELRNGKRHPAISHSFSYGKHWIGVSDDNFLYELSYKFFTYRGDLIRCFIITPPLYAENNNRIRVDNLYLEMATGLPGITLPIQYANPQANDLVITNEEPYVIISVSRDGGRTYGNGRRLDMGSIGQFIRIMQLRRLGCYKGRRVTFKIEFPFKIPFILIGAYVAYAVLLQ